MRAARATGVVLLALAACRDGGTGSGPSPSSSGAPLSSPSSSAAPLTSPGAGRRRTTDGALALRNLDAQIQGATRLADQRPTDAGAQEKLIRLLLDRGATLGRIADFEQALTRAEALVKAQPDRSDAYRARASARAALHRFQDALADLDRAQALGAKPAELDATRAGALEGLGRLDGALPLRRRAREAYATIATLGAEAALLGEMGRYEEADQGFARALAVYRDVSPFPVAWVAMKRGLMWERAGELDRARQHLADAHARLPLYAHAAAHLAALEPPSRAVAILEPVARSADDPQILAQLAEARRLAGAGDDAALLEQARRRFEELERRHPLAIADHAAAFWLGAGRDPARGAALAQKNVEARPTAQAHELLVDALGQAGKKDAACAAAEEALKLRYPTPRLLDIARRAFKACDRTDLGAAVPAVP